MQHPHPDFLPYAPPKPNGTFPAANSSSPAPHMPPHSPSSSSPTSPASPPPFKPLNSTATDTTTASTLPSDDSTARRRRKVIKTRIFEISTAPTQTRRFSTGARGIQGRGEKLANIPNVAYAIEKCNSKDPQLEFLHRVLFNTAGQAKKRKTSIRVFSGFMFQSQQERAKIRDKILRANMYMFRRLTYLLDVDMKDSKEATADDILAFLELPRVIDGRGNRAERERLQRAEKKRAEKARAKKRKEEEQKKKEEEMRRMRNGLNSKSDSDEDGDEDLEYEARPWIVIAVEREEARERMRNVEEEPTDQQSSDHELDVSASDCDQSVDNETVLQPTDAMDEEKRRRAESILLCGDDNQMDVE